MTRRMSHYGSPWLWEDAPEILAAVARGEWLLWQLSFRMRDPNILLRLQDVEGPYALSDDWRCEGILVLLLDSKEEFWC
jgi:hypothetical protein